MLIYKHVSINVTVVVCCFFDVEESGGSKTSKLYAFHTFIQNNQRIKSGNLAAN